MYMMPWTLEKLISHIIAVPVPWFASLLLLLPSVGPLVFSLNLAFSTGVQWLLDSPDASLFLRAVFEMLSEKPRLH